MITQQVIDALYKKYNKAPKSLDYLDMPLLFDATSPHHDVSVDIDDNICITENFWWSTDINGHNLYCLESQ